MTKQNHETQEFLNNVYAQIPSKDKSTTAAQTYCLHQSPGHSNTAKTYGTQPLHRRQSLLTKEHQSVSGTPNTNKDQTHPKPAKAGNISIVDTNLIASLSELKNPISDEDYTNTCGTRMSR